MRLVIEKYGNNASHISIIILLSIAPTKNNEIKYDDISNIAEANSIRKNDYTIDDLNDKIIDNKTNNTNLKNSSEKEREEFINDADLPNTNAELLETIEDTEYLLNLYNVSEYDDSDKPPLTINELLEIDFTKKHALTVREKEAIHKYFNEIKKEELPEKFTEIDIVELAKTTRPLVNKLAICIQHPVSNELTNRGYVPIEIKEDIPYDQPYIDKHKGIHPMEAITERAIRGDFNPMQRKTSTYVYPEFSDYYPLNSDAEVASYLLSKANRQKVIDETMNPTRYPFKIPYNFNLWDVELPTKDEEIYSIQLNKLQHPYDWHILRQPIESLTFEELDRVVHLASLKEKSHRRQTVIRNDLIAKFSKKLQKRNPKLEIPALYAQQQSLSKFFINKSNIVNIFHLNTHKKRQKELVEKYKEHEAQRFDPDDVAKHKAYAESSAQFDSAKFREDNEFAFRIRENERKYKSYEYIYLVPYYMFKSLLG